MDGSPRLLLIVLAGALAAAIVVCAKVGECRPGDHGFYVGGVKMGGCGPTIEETKR